ncbi:hypothetical protein MCEMSEM18_03573 [Comamonadaceae bacterium]
MSYYVVRYTPNETTVMAGLGRNRGTWDTAHTRRTAQRHARTLRLEDPKSTYKVETL